MFMATGMWFVLARLCRIMSKQWTMLNSEQVTYAKSVNWRHHGDATDESG